MKKLNSFIFLFGMVFSMMLSTPLNQSKDVYAASNVPTLIKKGNDWYKTKSHTNSQVDTAYTGLVPFKKDYFYVEKGKVNFKFTGLSKYKNTWYFVKNGKLDWVSTTLVKHNHQLFYVSKGKVQWGYSGKFDFNGLRYTVKNGQVDIKIKPVTLSKNLPVKKQYDSRFYTPTGQVIGVTSTAWVKKGKNTYLADTTPYVIKGSVNSKIYHVPGQMDYNKIAVKNVIHFANEKDALRLGYRKAKR